MSFFAELKRRNVFKVGIAYAIVAWLLIQVASVLFPTFDAPDWVMRVFTTVVILGFPIALIIAWAFELTPEGIKKTTSVPVADSITQQTGQRLNYIVTGLLGLAVAFMALDNYVLKKGRSQEPEVRIAKSSEPAISGETITSDQGQVTNDQSKPAIAVLPFTNMSEDKANEYFADGIAEEILNSLARIKDLEVRGRTSSFYFKGKNEDLHAISRMLNVKFILEGSVRKAGEQVRITVQLINTITDDHIWSKTYDRTLKDIFTIQEDIARSVADTLQVSLGVGELGRTAGMTRNVEAYEAFLAGRSLLYKLGREDVSRAIEKLEQAVALDPGFAIGWNLLANVYQAAGSTFIPEKADEYFTKRDAARDRVVELAPEADYALRIKAAQSGNRVEVERLWKQALALNPEDYETNFGYGQFLRNVGRPTEAIDYFQRAMRVEPLTGPYLVLGIAYEMSGNLTAAAATYKKGRELSTNPTVFNASLLVIAMEENDRAGIDEFFASAPAPENNTYTTRSLDEVTRALLDKPEDAGIRLRELLSEPDYKNPYNRQAVAVWAAYFGQYELALEIYQGIGAGIINVAWRPILKPMRRLSGFNDLVIKSGLVDYWRTSGNWGEFCHPVGKDDFECE